MFKETTKREKICKAVVFMENYEERNAEECYTEQRLRIPRPKSSAIYIVIQYS